MNYLAPISFLGSVVILSQLLSGCGINQANELRVVVMPQAMGDAWAQDEAQVDGTVNVELAGGTELVAGVDVNCLMEDNLRSFDCNASIEGNAIFLDLEVKARKGTDDCRGGFRRICPIGAVPPGDYEIHALGQTISISVPSTVSGDALIIPPLLPEEDPLSE